MNSSGSGPNDVITPPQDDETQQAKIVAPCKDGNGKDAEVEEKNDEAAMELPGAGEIASSATDEFDLFVSHEDFGQLLSIAAKVKAIKNSTTQSVNSALSPLSPDDNDVAATTVRENLVAGRPIIKRGTSPQTDSLMDESIDSLTKEFHRCLALESPAPNEEDVATKGDDEEEAERPSKKKKRNDRKEVIAVKYSKRQTDILTDWMIEHMSHPFPTSSEIKELGEKTDLTQSQVVNWTTNVRKRNLKATVEGGKKPHHFLDFLFLADAREKRQREAPKGVAATVKKGRKSTKAGKKKPSAASATRRSNRKVERYSSMKSPPRTLPRNRTIHPITPNGVPTPNTPFPNSFMQSTTSAGSSGHPPSPMYPPHYAPQYYHHHPTRKHSIESPPTMGAELVHLVSPSRPNEVISSSGQFISESSVRHQGVHRNSLQSPEIDGECNALGIEYANVWTKGMSSSYNNLQLEGEGSSSILASIEPSGACEDHERDMILKHTDGGIISSPPRDEDADCDELWTGTDELMPTVTADEEMDASTQ